MAVTVVWAQQPIPAGPSVFLAGPTPRDGGVSSWRLDMVAELEKVWPRPGLAVLVPEPQSGVWTSDYDRQTSWEWAALDTASVILFWVPRDVQTMPGFTTNVEFGLYAGSGRVVLGVPPGCPNPERNRYLVAVAGRFGIPVCETMPDTAAAALKLAGGR
jgi:hypothetical protein